MMGLLHRLIPNWFSRAAEQRTETTGQTGERLAAAHLRRKGLRIVARNVRNTCGEIDIIAVETRKKIRTIVFVEVKTRSAAENGAGPADAVDARKQRQITNAALLYLRSHRLLNHSARFDVVSVILNAVGGKPELRHFENAFEAVGDFQMFQ